MNTNNSCWILFGNSSARWGKLYRTFRVKELLYKIAAYFRDIGLVRQEQGWVDLCLSA